MRRVLMSALVCALTVSGFFADDLINRFAAKAPLAPRPIAYHVKLGNIEPEHVNIVIAQLHHLSASQPKEIIIAIDSQGGDVLAGRLLTRTIELLRAQGIKVTCVADGRLMSMAVYVLQGCSDRLATRQTVFMAHEPWVTVRGPARVLREHARDVQAQADEMAEYIGDRVNIGTRGYKHITSGADYYFGYKEALEMGFIDGEAVPPASMPMAPQQLPDFTSPSWP